MLVQYLPPESATISALRAHAKEQGIEVDQDDLPTSAEGERWSQLEHLIAATKDVMTQFFWAWSYSRSGKHPGWDFKPTPRPGVNAEQKPALAPEQLSVLAAHLARTQGAEGDTTYN